MRYPFTTALLIAIGTTASAETIQLKDGDVINAPITAQDDASVTIKHASLGDIKISRDKISAIYADPDAMAASLAEAAAKDKAAALEAERAADEGLMGVGLFAGWNRQLEAGLNGSDGNSENLNFRLAFHGDYEDAEDRWIFDMIYRRATSNGNVTDNNFQTKLTKDWLLPEEDYFYFANGIFDWDDLQDWEYRLGGFGGLGYQFMKNDKWDVKGRAGLGGNREFGSANNAFTPEALLGAEATYQISDNQSIAMSNTLFPSLEEFGDFRNITTLDYVIAIDRDKGMNLKIGIANEHDSEVTPGTKKNDFDYYASLVWSF